ncbi:hypothetical protein C1646_666951 [Rhizophagus diaphanus]|nr:hypothetical protein C1646_666951 [Rhizophagus diaphanus] [Rhizophagus sp. MUCL 43196]
MNSDIITGFFLKNEKRKMFPLFFLGLLGIFSLENWKMKRFMSFQVYGFLIDKMMVYRFLVDKIMVYGFLVDKIMISDFGVEWFSQILELGTLKKCCTESQFFGVFKGHIHNYYPKTGNYKCMFKGVDSYSTLSHILGDDNWGAKYFLHHQKTFILSYQLPSNPCDSKESYQCQESDPLQEPDLLKESDPL